MCAWQCFTERETSFRGLSPTVNEVAITLGVRLLRCSYHTWWHVTQFYGKPHNQATLANVSNMRTQPPFMYAQPGVVNKSHGLKGSDGT